MCFGIIVWGSIAAVLALITGWKAYRFFCPKKENAELYTPPEEPKDSPIIKNKKEELGEIVWHSLINHPDEWEESTHHWHGGRRGGSYTIFTNNELNMVLRCQSDPTLVITNDNDQTEYINGLGDEFKKNLHDLLNKHAEIRKYNEEQKQKLLEEEKVVKVIDKFWEQLQKQLQK